MFRRHCFRKLTSQEPQWVFKGRHTSTGYKDFYESSIEETWAWMTIIQMYWTWKGSLKTYRGSRVFPVLRPRPGSRRKSQLLIACWRKTVLKATTSITHGCCGGFMFHRGEIKMTSTGCHVSCVDSTMGTQREPKFEQATDIWTRTTCSGNTRQKKHNHMLCSKTFLPAEPFKIWNEYVNNFMTH